LFSHAGNGMTASERARRALQSALFDVAPREPYAATILRARRAAGTGGDARALLTYWDSVHPGSEIGTTRYRWLVSHGHVEIPRWAGPPDAWTPWRPAEQGLVDPFDFEARLSIPAIVTDCGELLAELANGPDAELAARAQLRLTEAIPVMRREFARFVTASHAWSDTFALWCLARRPRLFERLQPLALAIATIYAATAGAEGGVVRGTRFPFHLTPLASASAQLAAALLALGEELPLAGSLVDFVVHARRANGGWGDGDGPADVLTTLVAFELLLHVDPTFDPAPTVTFLDSQQREDGTWRCHGPEIPWLTAAIADALESASGAFADRFRWPHAPAANRDQKTRLPFFAWFDLLARLFAALPGLATAQTDVAFLDLAGFRAFNNGHGQDAGDAVLAAFATELTRLAAARPIRDGGDEFLVLGAPGRAGLAQDLETFRRAWPAAFRARFGADVPTVAARILVTRTRGADLRQARERLGRTIGTLKHRDAPGPEGLLVEV
jgi:GGDEF domain-containing protein